MQLDIREIQPEDDAALAAIIRQTLTEFGANQPGFAWSDPELDALSTAYTGDGAVYYVVISEQTLMGGAGIAPFPCQYAGLCELQKMYLLPAARGQGIGQVLMTRLLATAQTYGYRGCYLETFHTMERAIQLYQRAGFHRLNAPLGQTGHSACNQFYVNWFSTQETTQETSLPIHSS